MTDYKTPGVYIKEENLFGSSIVQNETSIPIFIGFTEIAVDGNGKELKKLKGSTIVSEPVLVNDLVAYNRCFGGPDATGTIYLTTTTDEDQRETLIAENKNSEGNEAYVPGLMYPSVLNYFTNGGGSCYILSIGTHSDFDPSFASRISSEMDFIHKAIQQAERSTLILPTDLIRFGSDHYYSWATQLTNFAEEEKKHFVILDVIQSDSNSDVLDENDIVQYRDAVSPDSPSYAGTYYPYLKSLTAYGYKRDLSNVYLDGNPLETETSKDILKKVETFLSTNYINMPPSPFMAGIYAKLDYNTGVWTPPANIAPVNITEPLVPITNKEQETMNVDVTAGKSINAIRNFPGRGTLVWGARTNDGNSLDWRYINVRRLFIAMETDISMALKQYVFKPNVHNTWVEVKTMIESYLFGLYSQGAFAGTTPENSYQVLIGLGETMTDEDVLNGYMRVTIQVAPVRPAEFIVLTFTQMVAQ